MGVTDLSKLLRKSNLLKNLLSELCGKRVGIDLSVILHKSYSHGDFSMDFHQEPPISLYYLIEFELNKLLSIFTKCKVIPILYVDGAYHPLKEKENALRQKAISNSNSSSYHFSISNSNSSSSTKY